MLGDCTEKLKEKDKVIDAYKKSSRRELSDMQGYSVSEKEREEISRLRNEVEILRQENLRLKGGNNGLHSNGDFLTSKVVNDGNNEQVLNLNTISLSLAPFLTNQGAAGLSNYV